MSRHRGWFLLILPSKPAGQLHSVKGTVVETVGNLTGSANLQQSGREEHAAGETEVTAANTKLQTDAVKDKVTGVKDSVVGAVTNDKSQQAQGGCHVSSIERTRFESHYSRLLGDLQQKEGDAKKSVT